MTQCSPSLYLLGYVYRRIDPKTASQKDRGHSMNVLGLLGDQTGSVASTFLWLLLIVTAATGVVIIIGTGTSIGQALHLASACTAPAPAPSPDRPWTSGPLHSCWQTAATPQDSGREISLRTSSPSPI